MKTILRSLLFTALLSFCSLRTIAQCSVTDVIIQNVAVAGVQTPGACTITFDASFTIENNNGNKYIFIHTWLQQDYPNYFHCENGQTTLNGAIHSPQSADLVNSFLSIGINNNEDTPAIITSYPPDPSVPLADISSIERELLPDGSAVFILHGITTTIPVTCGTPILVVADLWSSQAANAQVAHCVNCGIINSAGFMNVSGLANCSTLTFGATITNLTSTEITGVYTVNADVNADGYYTPAIDTAITDTASFHIVAGAGMTTSISGSIPAANTGQDLFVVLRQNSGTGAGAARVARIPSTQCAPLPVTFKSFNATRMNGAAVALKWETATEINNKGFALQRNMGNNNWEFITFINSQAQGGNSADALLYSYTDKNSNKAITQYRIKQVDIDNRAKFSEIRAVRGYGQNTGTIIYPTPSNDGRVNVVFSDKDGTREITLIDMSGHMIRQWHGVTGNTIQIDNLREGMYNLRIITRETGEQENKKVMVGK